MNWIADDERQTVARFWAFSVALYEQPGLAPWCLTIQDQHRGNVNTALLCLWAGRHRLEFDKPLLGALGECIDGWQHECLKPLRRLRSRLKSPIAGVDDEGRLTFRGQLQTLELSAEALEQRILIRCLREHRQGWSESAPTTDCSAANLLVYADDLQLPQSLRAPIPDFGRLAGKIDH